jgi:carboxylesterase
MSGESREKAIAKSLIKNPHLEGESFFWKRGPVGILLSHGFTATTAEVRLLAKYLHDCGYTVAGPLLPGHFSTPTDLNRVRWQDWSATYEAMYRRISETCEIVFVGGESAGGLLALRLVSQHPEVAGVLAYAPALRLNARKFDILRLQLLAPFVAYISKPVSDDDTPWQGYSVIPLKGAIQLIKMQQEVLARLPEIHQPVLIVQGRLDMSVHPGVPELISQSVSSKVKEIRWMEKSGHVVIVDREWQTVAELTQQFIQRVLKRQYAHKYMP